MRQFFKRLWCRWFNHKLVQKPMEAVKDPTGLYPQGISAYVFYNPSCARCGATDFFGWVKTKGYLEQTDGNTDVLKGPRP